MKSFPYFEFIAFIMPGGYFLCLMTIILNRLGLSDVFNFGELSNSMEILFVVTLAMIHGHLLGIIANLIEKRFWHGKKRNNILKVYNSKVISGEVVLITTEDSKEIFAFWDNAYIALQNRNLLDTISKLFAQARFAQNIAVANCIAMITYFVCYLCMKKDASFTIDAQGIVLVSFLVAMTIFCTYLFLDRDKHKVTKVYNQFEELMRPMKV